MLCFPKTEIHRLKEIGGGVRAELDSVDGSPCNGITDDALDARIEIRAASMTPLREIKNSEGFSSSDSTTVEFGLGKAARVELMDFHIVKTRGLGKSS